MSENELGAFLRARREAVAPTAVGLPTGTRRRTPGLRRAELAMLAGVSVEYLTRLEQGRDRHPSPQVLGALADALRLSPEERLHLRILAKATGGEHCAESTAPARAVRPTVRALLDRLEPTPACVVNRLGDLLAVTTGYRRLAGPVGLLDAGNTARFIFTDPRAREVYPDWAGVADDQIAALRATVNLSEPHLSALSAELAIVGGGEFTRRWQAPAPVPRRAGVERWRHPEVGVLRLAYEILALPAGDGQRLVVYLPADETTSECLGRLTAGRRDDPGTRSPAGVNGDRRRAAVMNRLTVA